MPQPTPSDEPPARFWHGPATAAVAFLAWLFRIVPTPIAYALADLIALGMVPLLWCQDRRGKRSGGFHRNIRVAFRGGPTPPALLWRNVRHLTWLAVDLARMPTVNEQNLARHVDTADLSKLDTILERTGRDGGLICVTGHIGSPEYLGHFMALRGHSVTGVYAPSPVPGITRVGERLRQSGGQRMISPRGVMWSLKKALDRGEMVGLAADTSNKTTPVHVPFLGVEAATSAMPGLLHLSTGKPIAVCTMERVGRMRFRLHVWDCFTHKATADRDRDLVSICTRINDSLSRAIIARPEQWFWHSRRFRRRPPGEQPRADGLPPFSEGDHPSFWAQGDRPAIQPAPGAGTI